MPKANSISYFDVEGNSNLPSVLKILKRTLGRRPELRDLKIVFLTAEGRGPALAYTLLEGYEPKIIAVTFPPGFCFVRDGSVFEPRIPERARKFFDGVGIPVLASRLAFDGFAGATSTFQNPLKLVADALAIFGGSIPLAIQAVLQACDMGKIRNGEVVFAVTGDCLLLVSAASTSNFLSQKNGMAILEIFCKARAFNITRKYIGLLPPSDESAIQLSIGANSK